MGVTAMEAMRAATLSVVVFVAVPGGLALWVTVLLPPFVGELGLQVADTLLHGLHFLWRGVGVVRTA